MQLDELKWPQNPEMERLILGAAILHQTAEFWLDITDKLNVKDFARPSHRAIFTAIDNLVNQGAVPDQLSVVDELRRTGGLDLAGGPAAIAETYDGVPRILDLSTEINRLKDLSMKRQMMKVGNWLMNAASADDEHYEEILNSVESKITNLSAARSAEDLIDSGTAARDTIAELVQRWASPEQVPGVSTGLPDLDNLLHGLRPGRQHLLAARPGEGKTTLALNIAHNALSPLRSKDAVGLIVSLEMSVKELTLRALSTITRIDSDRIITGRLSRDEKAAVIEAGDELAKMNINYIQPNGPLMLAGLSARARRLIRQHGRLDYIILDYLQLMSGQRKENRNVEIGEISRGLKLLTIALDLPMLTLSQMSREIEKRGGEPQLSDLRDSGSLEQDADVVMFLHDPNTNDQSGCPARKLLVKKQRGGKVGVVDLLWFKDQSRFAPAL